MTAPTAAFGARSTALEVVRGLSLAGRRASVTGGTSVQVALLDLADGASVRRFTDTWGTTPLHILINNAAIMACPLARTPQGWALQFAVNHLGHFALTTGLLPALPAAAACTSKTAASACRHRPASVSRASRPLSPTPRAPGASGRSRRPCWRRPDPADLAPPPGRTLSPRSRRSP